MSLFIPLSVILQIYKVRVINDTIVRITQRNKQQLLLTRQMDIQDSSYGGRELEAESFKMSLLPKKGVEVVEMQGLTLTIKAK